MKAFFLVTLLIAAMMIGITMAAAPVVTYACGDACIQGGSTIIQVALSGNFQNNAVVQLPLPWNSTIGDCYLYTTSRTQISMSAPSPITNKPAAMENKVGTAVELSFSGALVSEMYFECPFSFPPVQSSNGLKPYAGTSYPGFIIYTDTTRTSSYEPAQTISYPWPTVSGDNTCPGTQCGVGLWSAGKGLAGYVEYRFYPSTDLDTFDQIEVSGIANSDTITDCTLGGSPLTIERLSNPFRAVLGSNVGPGEMGYVSLICRLTIPQNAAATNVVITASRRYYANPDIDSYETFKRFSASSQIGSPSASIIGKGAGTTNDATISLFPSSLVLGQQYSVVVQTSFFNTQLQSVTSTTGGDNPITTVTYSQLHLTLKFGEKFLTQFPDVTPTCTYTVNSRAPNFNAGYGSTSTEKITGGLKFKFTASRELNVGTSTFRFFCNGLKLVDDFTGTLPYTPKANTNGDALTASVEVFSPGKPDSNSIIGQNEAIVFQTVVATDAGGVPVDWVKHTLFLKTNNLLTQEQINRLIAQYRTTLKLSGSETIIVSTQSYDSATDMLRVYVAIAGTAQHSSSEIATLLSAASATTIANTLTQEFSYTAYATQYPAKIEQTPAHCNNQIKDEDEIGVDCGGPSCIGCTAKDSVCAANSDCSSGLCDNALCKYNTNNVIMINSFITFVIIVIVQLF